MTDAVIHRVSEDVGGVVCSVTEGQWIATGLRPRDDKVVDRTLSRSQHTLVIARRERK